MSHKYKWITAAAIAPGLVAMAAPAAATTVPPAAAPHWRIVKSVKSGDTGGFTAVVATGKTTGWAFDGFGSPSGPAAWQRTGKGWARDRHFPARPDETVITAAATSPSGVWAFTDNFAGPSRVLRYNGRAWSVVKTFSDPIGNATVLAGNNVWVFGDPAAPRQPALGVWHYNGRTWTRAGRNIAGGSALSATNAWGFNGVDVEHLAGGKWVATSVRALLPGRNPQRLNDPQVVGILALSARSVYAFGNGDAEDEGGPLVVLHFNGSRWAKVAQGSYGFGPSPEVSSDGSGGLWIPMQGPIESSGRLLHYANGKLTAATLPVPAAKITVAAISRVPGTAGQLAGGLTLPSFINPGTNVTGVILQYS